MKDISIKSEYPLPIFWCKKRKKFSGHRKMYVCESVIETNPIFRDSLTKMNVYAFCILRVEMRITQEMHMLRTPRNGLFIVITNVQ